MVRDPPGAGRDVIQAVQELRGELRVIGDNATLVLEDGAAIAIAVPGFLERLLDGVPCYVGGSYLYRDRVLIFGTVDSRTRLLVEFQSGTLFREDEGEYPF